LDFFVTFRIDGPLIKLKMYNVPIVVGYLKKLGDFLLKTDSDQTCV